MFSWESTITRAHKHKVQRLKNQAKSQHPDLKRIHPDWCRAASEGKFDQLTKETLKKLKDNLKLSENRRRKIAGLEQVD